MPITPLVAPEKMLLNINFAVNVVVNAYIFLMPRKLQLFKRVINLMRIFTSKCIAYLYTNSGHSRMWQDVIKIILKSRLCSGKQVREKVCTPDDYSVYLFMNVCTYVLCTHPCLSVCKHRWLDMCEYSGVCVGEAHNLL